MAIIMVQHQQLRHFFFWLSGFFVKYDNWGADHVCGVAFSL
jgi:hypothetical protein